ncbi:hypothetical protein [Lysobacter sp. CA199]|uniref:hypothetical protein n=1 Tax=Lysobacter sp. CA199 TaxID=3455608 RepID=UPI003F8D0A45
MSREIAEFFLAALNKACGEIDQAATYSEALFSDEEERKSVRRELARLMNQIDSRIIPVLRRRYPDIEGYLPVPKQQPGDCESSSTTG